MQFEPTKQEGQEIYVTEGLCIGVFANPMPDGKSTRYVVSMHNPDPKGKPDKFSTFDENLIKGIEKGSPARVYFVIKGQYKNLCYPPGEGQPQTIPTHAYQPLAPSVAQPIQYQPAQQAGDASTAETPLDEPTDIEDSQKSREIRRMNALSHATDLFRFMAEFQETAAGYSMEDAAREVAKIAGKVFEPYILLGLGE